MPLSQLLASKWAAIQCHKRLKATYSKRPLTNTWWNCTWTRAFPAGNPRLRRSSGICIGSVVRPAYRHVVYKVPWQQVRADSHGTTTSASHVHQTPYNQCQSMSISVNQCQSMSISVNQCQSVSISVNQCQLMSISVNQCQSMSISVNQCQSASINVN